MEDDSRQSGWLSSDKAFYWAVAGIMVFALALRLMGLDKGIWLDEAGSLRRTLGKSVLDTFQAWRQDDHPPLAYLLLNLWSRMGTSEPFLRLLSVVFGMGTVVVVVFWMKQYSRLASVLCAVCFTATPILLRYSQELRNYALLILAEALAFLFASRLAARPEKTSGYVGLSLSLSLAVATHLLGILLIAPTCAFAILMAKDKKAIRLARGLLAMAPPCFIFAFFWFFYFHGIGKIQHDFWMPQVSLSLAVFVLRSLLGWSVVGQWGYLMLVWVAVLAVRGDWRRSFPFLVAAVLFFAEVIAYSLLRTPIFWPRTLLPILVPLFGFLAVHIATVREKWLKAASVAAVLSVSLAFGINWATHAAWKPEEDWRKASQVLASRLHENDLTLFYAASVSDPIQYYLPKLSPKATVEIPVDEPFKELVPEIESKLAALEKGARPPGVFLVLRPSMRIIKGPQSYQDVLSFLARKLATPSQRACVIVCPTFRKEGPGQPRDRLSEGLETVLGHPASFQDLGSVLLFQYGPQGAR